MWSSACRMGCWGLAALLLWLPTGAVHAAPFTLRLRPLRDAGGVEHELPARLTNALAHLLGDHGDLTMRIETTERPGSGGERDTATRYALEGEVSYASGSGEGSGRYLLVARLLREGRTRALIGQWAGSASSLRYLTANLRRDPRVNTLGLIGEIGSRVLAAIAADTTSPEGQWRTLLSGLQPLRSPKARMVSVDRPTSPASEAAGGDTFRVRFEPPMPLRAYLILSGTDGKLVVQPLTLADGKTSPPHESLAESQVVHVPKGTRETWLLCRGGATPHGAGTAHAEGRLPRRCTCRADEDDAPVHVLNGVGIGTAVRDETLTPLLEEIVREPRPWRVLRLRLAASPK